MRTSVSARINASSPAEFSPGCAGRRQLSVSQNQRGPRKRHSPLSGLVFFLKISLRFSRNCGEAFMTLAGRHGQQCAAVFGLHLNRRPHGVIPNACACISRIETISALGAVLSQTELDAHPQAGISSRDAGCNPRARPGSRLFSASLRSARGPHATHLRIRVGPRDGI